ncbi:MAG TPA: molybdenum cofactor guanylyltransferase [Blastocatellia bacterium]|nr:molybdenum cofactor guanylyltransferase [Blastocatellia bacterium]HMV82520.1 molybdenum cofactor guanylyltransferase [Blastocatellia bacterium]HMX24666.1 molybdenum cofactor guanylyltransferase [Blastocatellia bacterium]HMY75780.1 molybdenum cofactor guanylyltransferase [Blastocatellia bacterium]HMZ18910.1 molybdenum cofactor guanylyltransferase [Blastocatellia bacterium]
MSDKQIQVFIQAGGRSSRMGVDKAWLEINGQPMIEHVLAAARPVADGLSIVIHPANPNAARYSELAASRQARLLNDLHDHQGPLGGIYTALANCRAGEAALILACDVPFLTTEFLEFLCRKHRARAPQVTVPLCADGRLQPLAAIYDQSCLAAVEEKLARQELKVGRLFDAVRSELIDFQEFAHLPGASKFFLNLNTMAEYRSAAPDSPTGESGAC